MCMCAHIWTTILRVPHYFSLKFMAENNGTTFRLIKSSRGGNNSTRTDFYLTNHKILGEITYLLAMWKKKRVQTQKHIEILELSHIWLVDGTFKTASLLFGQTYCIHGLRSGPTPLEDGHLLPSFFALLPNKSQ